MNPRHPQPSPSGCALVGVDHRICWVDARLASLLGYPPAELVGVPFEQITHSEDRDLDSHLADRLFDGQLAGYEIQKRFIQKDGAIVRLNLHASVIRDALGQIVYGVGLLNELKDVTDLQESRRSAGLTTEAEAEAERIRRAIFGV